MDKKIEKFEEKKKKKSIGSLVSCMVVNCVWRYEWSMNEEWKLVWKKLIREVICVKGVDLFVRFVRVKFGFCLVGNGKCASEF